MLRRVLPLFSIVVLFVSAEAQAVGPKALRELCASFLGPSRADRARAFEASVDALDDAHLGPIEARDIGSRILEFPELYLRAYRAGKPSPLARLMTSPELAQAFFAANPYNGLVAYDLLAVASRRSPDDYREAIRDAMRTVVVTSAVQMKANHPAFDVPKEQARALDLCRWIHADDEEVIAAAFGFLDPSSTRFFKRAKTLRSLGHRANSAADFIHRLTLEGGVSAARVEWLVGHALNLGHPFRTHYWTALVSPTLTDAQLERLAHAWSRPVLLERERDEIRLKSPRLIETVEALIRRSPRKFNVSR